MPTIKFTDTTTTIPPEYYPVPGKHALPEWLKNLEPYFDGKFTIDNSSHANNTGKRCLPMLDAVMSGYVIKTTHDLEISQIDDAPYYKWRAGLGIDFHNPKQLSTHEAGQRGYYIPKWNNPWSIQTPTGYSSLFVAPLNGDRSPIKAFSGIVDTDTYHSQVNIPFIIEHGWTGIIEAGTPIVQVFPFRRESWVMETVTGYPTRLAQIDESIRGAFRNAYRKLYWSRKDYS